MHAHKHTWNNGAAATTQGADADAGSFARLFHSTNNHSHLAPPMLGLHGTHFLRHQYSSTTHHLFPTYPRTVGGPRILGGRDFTVPHWSTQQSAPLWRSSAQLHNGPLRSCRKIRGKAGAQQCRSTQESSPSLASTQESKPENDQGDCSRKTRGQWKTTKPPQQPITQSRQCGAHTTSTDLTGVRPIRPVHGQHMSLATKAIPRNEVAFSPFSRACSYTCYKYIKRQMMLNNV